MYDVLNIQKLFGQLLFYQLIFLYNVHLYIVRRKIKLHHNYILFDMNQLNKNNILYFFNNLMEIIRSKDYYNNSMRIIIFNNFNLIKNIIQNKLRVILEKYRSTTLFILITHKYNSIINPIRSRCLSIRFPSLTPYEKRNLTTFFISFFCSSIK